MDFRSFPDTGTMEAAAAAMLVQCFTAAHEKPFAVMLTGGRTPFSLYARIAGMAPRPDPHLHVLVSDERLVPESSSEHNFSRIGEMLRALGISSERQMQVDTGLPLGEAADAYHNALTAFLASGCIALGILGLGADGHLASLFTVEDAARAGDRLAVAVPRDDGPDRVSVGPRLLASVKRLVFYVTGTEKADIVTRMKQDPASVVAGRILNERPGVEIWHSVGL